MKATYVTRPRERAAYVALLTIAAAMLAGIALTGCSRTAGASDASSASTARLWAYQGHALEWVQGTEPWLSSSVLVDQETGVEYLLVRDYARGGVSVTPLLNADGTLCKAVE